MKKNEQSVTKTGSEYQLFLCASVTQRVLLICDDMLLMLNSYGCSLSRKSGRFCVKREEKTHYLSPERIEGILLTTACTVTTDALMLALDHEIPVVLVGRDGEPAGMFWSHRYGSIATIRRQQLLFSHSPEATAWIIDILHQKTTRQVTLLRDLALLRPSYQSGLNSAARTMEGQKQQLDAYLGTPPQVCAASLRGIEGNLSRAYFQALGNALPKAYRFEQRSRRPARDRFNAALNYLYGMLYHTTEAALVMAGLDPYLPVLHADEYARPAFAFDYIEAWRPWADQVVVKLCMEKSLLQIHFQEEAGGGVRLSQEGRKMIIPAFQEFVSEKEHFPEGRRERQEYVFRSARRLAGFLLDQAQAAA